MSGLGTRSPLWQPKSTRPLSVTCSTPSFFPALVFTLFFIPLPLSPRLIQNVCARLLLIPILVCASRRPNKQEMRLYFSVDSGPVSPEHPFASVPDAIDRCINSMPLPFSTWNSLLLGFLHRIQRDPGTFQKAYPRLSLCPSNNSILSFPCSLST